VEPKLGASFRAALNASFPVGIACFNFFKRFLYSSGEPFSSPSTITMSFPLPLYKVIGVEPKRGASFRAALNAGSLIRIILFSRSPIFSSRCFVLHNPFFSLRLSA